MWLIVDPEAARDGRSILRFVYYDENSVHNSLVVDESARKLSPEFLELFRRCGGRIRGITDDGPTVWLL